ncbi:MAG TPA: bifunctional tetrahydrofolate synthase/dihydrofolate synthase [Burkholderiaceae bacterium]|nr:bifunctional tetrahydrofolate synthase/dihydrofolate synthase [Burkholderiaceae bacterium]
MTELDAWLQRIERLHHRPIEMGLARVREVAQRLALELNCPSIIVAGTNGKGSTCAMLDAILRADGYRVGRYSSPHLLRFNERAAIDGSPAGDQELIEQFDEVERARGDVSLTYFEFTTLAVLRLFSSRRLDAAVLEIGLGGRLDAVNLIDADCSVVTSIGLDHADFLGSTRDSVAFEKAHVYRSGRPAICSDPSPPGSLLEYARSIGADLRILGRDFNVIAFPQSDGPPQPPRQWTYQGPTMRRAALPIPSLRGDHQLRNAAGAIAALEALQQLLPVSQQAVREGLLRAKIEARFQVLPGRPAVILDVAHNPQAAEALARTLDQHPCQGRTRAVFAMLRDKDVAGVAQQMGPTIDWWYLAPTSGPRGLDAPTLASIMQQVPAAAGRFESRFASVHDALAAARAAAAQDDRIVVFGSFVTVAEAMRDLGRGQGAG